MSDQKQSFGIQAARFSLYVPLMVIVIGFVSINQSDQPSIAKVLAGLNVVLLLAGLCLGIIALVSIRRYGKKGILGRAVLGVIFNGVVLALLVSLLMPVFQVGRIKTKIVGSWVFRDSGDVGAQELKLTLNDDGQCTMEASNGGKIVLVLGGIWVMTSDRVIGVDVESVTKGDKNVVGKRVGLGRLQSVDDEQMILKNDNREEKFTRVR